MNLMRTDRTYKTFENAEKALAKAMGLSIEEMRSVNTARYLIAATPEGRFAPALVGASYIAYAHKGITVVA
jgi:hypothetical protein